MIAHSDAELNRMIMAELRSAMNEAAFQMERDMESATQYFYSGGQPRMYHRTGALGETPRVSDIRESDNSVEFEAYLDQSNMYSTGKDPTMSDVLNLANYGYTHGSVGRLRPTVGNAKFWERAKDDMESTLKRIMSKHGFK
jgi:hypothetical protein